jgi:hypothetical protein
MNKTALQKTAGGFLRLGYIVERLLGMLQFQ